MKSVIIAIPVLETVSKTRYFLYHRYGKQKLANIPISIQVLAALEISALCEFHFGPNTRINILRLGFYTRNGTINRIGNNSNLMNDLKQVIAGYTKNVAL